MTECCENKSLVLYSQQNNSRFFGTDWLSIKFNSELPLDGFSAKFKLGIAERSWDTLVDGIVINLDEQEIQALPLGINYATLLVTDNEGNRKPFSTAIPVLKKDWVEGDQKINTFEMSVDAKVEGETYLTINIEAIQGGGSGSGNIDGGSSTTVYLESQVIDGGNATQQ